MEDREKEYLHLNLEQLVHMTYCSADFLQNLVAADILSDGDVAEIVQCRRDNGSYAESSMLYRKCMARPKSYEALINALLETKQTEPLEIMMDFYRTSHPGDHPKKETVADGGGENKTSSN